MAKPKKPPPARIRAFRISIPPNRTEIHRYPPGIREDILAPALLDIAKNPCVGNRLRGDGADEYCIVSHLRHGFNIIYTWNPDDAVVIVLAIFQSNGGRNARSSRRVAPLMNAPGHAKEIRRPCCDLDELEAMADRQVEIRPWLDALIRPKTHR